jgi:hypothetical protein
MHYNKIVVGGNLSSFLYSYSHGLPLVVNRLAPPHRFERVGDYAQIDLWKKLYFLLSLSGLNLTGDKAQQVRIKDNDQLVVTLSGANLLKVNFNELILFDDENISGLPLPIKENKKFLVLDWMVARSCMEHKFEHFHTGDDFVKDIYFYPTERLSGVHPNKRDLAAISYLTEEQLLDFDYSDTYARFKTTKVMKENGITGRKNGFSNGRQVHYALKLEVNHRESRKIQMNLYENTENIKFNYSSAVDLYFTGSGNLYHHKLNNHFNIL